MMESQVNAPVGSWLRALIATSTFSFLANSDASEIRYNSGVGGPGIGVPSGKTIRAVGNA